MLLTKVLETVHDDANIVTIIHIDTWEAHPTVHVLMYILSVGHKTIQYTYDHAHHRAPVKQPDLLVSCRSWLPMPIVLEEDPLLPG